MQRDRGVCVEGGKNKGHLAGYRVKETRSKKLVGKRRWGWECAMCLPKLATLREDLHYGSPP
eukprot:5741661-Amphidinium_carterae.3